MTETYNLRGLLNHFIKYLKDQKRSGFTIIAYKKDLEQFIGHLASIEKTEIKEVKKEDIESFINKLLSQNYTKKSTSRKLNSLRTFFRFLKSDGLIVQNPSLEVPHPKYAQPPPRILTKLEYRGLRDYAKNNIRTYTMIELLLQTGIRISELAAIKINDIKNNNLHLEGKNIPLNNTVKTAIDNYIKIRHKSTNNHLFVTKTGKPLLLRNIRTIIDKCFKEIDIQDATVNDLRNTFIGYQLSKGASVSYIAKIVGHKRLSSTERYLRLIQITKSQNKEKLEEL
ncbi:MAG: hypothetical protein ACD_12C00810G0002 [uncultured bacterium]|nr:MAG: hypothetical protein ACD_12C00810G0002 [uncultured bacterium]